MKTKKKRNKEAKKLLHQRITDLIEEANPKQKGSHLKIIHKK